jgi:hypothetical protein
MKLREIENKYCIECEEPLRECEIRANSIMCADCLAGNNPDY